MKYAHQFVTTSLNVGGGINDSQTTGIVIQSLNNVDATKPSVACISWADPLSTSVAEWVTYTSINSTTNELQGVTRGAEGYSAKSHSNGATVAFPISKSHINELNDTVLVEHNADGTHKNITADSINLNSGGTGNVLNNSLFRQALVNGNFDIWQRGTSFTGTAGSAYTADRWQVSAATGLAWTVARQSITENGSVYSIRVQRNNTEADTGVLQLDQNLESNDSIQFRGSKVTLSFYAKAGANYSPTSSILNCKVITGTGIDQNVYSGFTNAANLISSDVTLTTSWQKFTVTSSAAVGSTITQLAVRFLCTTTGTAGANDWFEVRQVQLCAGETDLPFMPKSFDDELKACQSWYEKSADYAVYTSALDDKGIVQMSIAGTAGRIPIIFKATKVKTPAVSVYSHSTSAVDKVRDITAGADVAASVILLGINGATASFTATDNNRVGFHWTADASL